MRVADRVLVPVVVEVGPDRHTVTSPAPAKGRTVSKSLDSAREKDPVISGDGCTYYESYTLDGDMKVRRLK